MSPLAFGVGSNRAFGISISKLVLPITLMYYDFNSSPGTSPVSGSLNTTLSGTVSLSGDGRVRQQLSSDKFWVTLPQSINYYATNGGLTIEGTYNYSSFAGSFYWSLMGAVGSNGSSPYIVLSKYGDGTPLLVQSNTGGGGGGLPNPSGATYHMFMTFYGSAIYYGFNGNCTSQTVASNANIDTSLGTYSTLNSVFIGNSGALYGGFYSNAYWDNFRVIHGSPYITVTPPSSQTTYTIPTF